MISTILYFTLFYTSPVDQLTVNLANVKNATTLAINSCSHEQGYPLTCGQYYNWKVVEPLLTQKQQSEGALYQHLVKIFHLDSRENPRGLTIANDPILSKYGVVCDRQSPGFWRSPNGKFYLDAGIGDLVDKINKAIQKNKVFDYVTSLSDRSEIFLSFAKNTRLSALSSLTPWANGLRVLVVDKESGATTVAFIPDQIESHETFLGDFNEMAGRLDMTQVPEAPVLLPQDSNFRVEIDEQYFDKEGRLNVSAGYLMEGHLAVYQGSIAMLVPLNHVVKKGDTLPEGLDRVAGANPTMLIGYRDDVSACNELELLIDGRDVYAISGGAMSQSAAEDKNDFGEYSNKTHVYNCQGIAEALFDVYIKRWEEQGIETVFLTGSLGYYGPFYAPSFDLLVAEHFQALLNKYLTSLKLAGITLPKHDKAFLHISDENSRHRDGRAWQTTENAGEDCVLRVEKNDISNNAKEMAITSFAKKIVLLGGGPTVFRNAIRASLMGVKITSVAFSNSKLGISGATHPEKDFKRIKDDVLNELRSELAKGPNSLIPEREIEDKENGYTLTVISGFPEAKVETVDLSTPINEREPIYGLKYSEFIPPDYSTPEEAEEKANESIRAYVRKNVLKALLVD